MINCLLIGPPQQGGEGVYVTEVFANPPEDVAYELSQQFHSNTANARCNVVQEVMLNRMLHPFLRYTFGFRSMRLGSGIDLVHVHSHPVRITGARKVPIVMSAGSSHYINVRDYEKWSEAKIRRRYALARTVFAPLHINDELLSSERVARIYTFSNWARQFYVQHGVPAHKVDVIYPGFDVPDGPRRVADQPGVRFLFVGRDFVRKGGPQVTAAFEQLRAQLPDVTLTVVTKDIGEVPQTAGVSVHDFMPREELYRNIYPNADVFVMPTYAEGWGFTNAEAMSFGMPVITTNINAMPEIVVPGETGILVAPGDGAALLAAMRRLADSADLRAEMGARGRERFMAKFSRAGMRAALSEFYHAALRN